MGQNTAIITRNMYAEAKRYVLTVLQAGVPLVDADYNDQMLSLFTQLRRVIQTGIGDGAAGDAFKIQQYLPDPVNNFMVTGGQTLATASITIDATPKVTALPQPGPEGLFNKGHNAQLWASETYKVGTETTPSSTKISTTAFTDDTLEDSAAQFVPGALVGLILVPDIATPANQYPIVANTANTIQANGTMVVVAGQNYRVMMTTPGAARKDLVYLDCYLDEINPTEDPNLKHQFDSMLIEAMFREKIIQTVLVQEGVALPMTIPTGWTDADGNAHVIVPLALIDRPAGNANITDAMITDLRRKIFRLDEIDDRFVNVTGDTMTGTLVMQANIIMAPGRKVLGTCVIDGNALCEDTVAQRHMKRDSHLLGSFDAVPTWSQVNNPLDPNHFKVHDNRYYCFSADTEILTEMGWKRHSDLREGEQIWSFDMETERLVKNPIQKIVRYTDFKRMWRFKSARADFMLTEDHGVVFRYPQSHPRTSARWRKKPTQEIANGSEVEIPVAGLAQDLPFDERRSAYWELYGWFVAEGWFVGNGMFICQNQGEDLERIKGLLGVLEIPVNERLQQPRGTPYRIRLPQRDGTEKVATGVTTEDHMALYIGVEYARRLGFRKDLKGLMDREDLDFEALLQGLVRGDGDWDSKEYGRFYQADETLIDDLQALCARYGYHTIKKPHVHGMWRLAVSKTHITTSLRRHWSTESYDGVAWCVSVPKGTVVVRRNGYVAVFGNTKSVLDAMIGANLISNGLFDDGLVGWENLAPRPLYGYPAIEAEKIIVAISLCGATCEGGFCSCRSLQVYIPAGNRICTVCAVRQEVCGGIKCGGEFMLIHTLCVTKGEEAVIPFMVFDLYSSCQYVGTRRYQMWTPSLDQPDKQGIDIYDGFVRMEKKIDLPKCVDNAVVTLCFQVIPLKVLNPPVPPITCDECRQGAPLTEGTGAIWFCVEDPVQLTPFAICRNFPTPEAVVDAIFFDLQSNRPGAAIVTILVDANGRRAVHADVATGGLDSFLVTVPSFSMPDGQVDWQNIVSWCQYWQDPQPYDDNATDNWKIDNVLVEGWNDIEALFEQQLAYCGYQGEPGQPRSMNRGPTPTPPDPNPPSPACEVGPDPFEISVCAVQMRRISGPEGEIDPGIGCKTNKIPVITTVQLDGTVNFTPAFNQVATVLEVLEEDCLVQEPEEPEGPQ